MSKLPEERQFFDLSDYGRPFAKVIAYSLKNTSLTPIHITLTFVISGLIAIVCIFNHYYWATAFFLVLKSILDAADGELARLKNTPSYTGRYLDSLSDIILNLLIMLSIWYVTEAPIIYTLLAFFGIQLQGTLYNYYYVILRNKYNGDTTSRIFEDRTPRAINGEKQANVDFLFSLYRLFYGVFDKLIYLMDSDAVKSQKLPNWFMTIVSSFGLGFQLLIIGLMMALGYENYVISFFIAYSFFIPIFIAIRRMINQ